MPGELVVSILGNVGIAAEVFESVPEGMEYDIVREAQFLVDVAVEPAAQHFTVGLVSAPSLERGPQAFLSVGFDRFHIVEKTQVDQLGMERNLPQAFVVFASADVKMGNRNTFDILYGEAAQFIQAGAGEQTQEGWPDPGMVASAAAVLALGEKPFRGKDLCQLFLAEGLAPFPGIDADFLGKAGIVKLGKGITGQGLDQGLHFLHCPWAPFAVLLPIFQQALPAEGSGVLFQWGDGQFWTGDGFSRLTPTQVPGCGPEGGGKGFKTFVQSPVMRLLFRREGVEEIFQNRAFGLVCPGDFPVHGGCFGLEGFVDFVDFDGIAAGQALGIPAVAGPQGKPQIAVPANLAGAGRKVQILALKSIRELAGKMEERASAEQVHWVIDLTFSYTSSHSV